MSKQDIDKSSRIRITPRKCTSINLALLSGVLFLFAGCGSDSGDYSNNQSSAASSGESAGSSGGRQSETKIDACSLLTKAEVEAVVGGAAEAPTQTETMYGGKSCTYMAATTSIAAPTVQVLIWPQAYTMKQLQEGLKENAGVSSFQPVPGVGEEAYWTSDTLYVRRGNVIFSVAAANLKQQPSGTSLEVSKDLAQKAIQRIP